MPLGRSEGGNFDLCNFCLALCLWMLRPRQREREGGGWMRERGRARRVCISVGATLLRKAMGDCMNINVSFCSTCPLPGPLPRLPQAFPCGPAQMLRDKFLRPVIALYKMWYPSSRGLPDRSECSLNSCTCDTSGRLVPVMFTVREGPTDGFRAGRLPA